MSADSIDYGVDVVFVIDSTESMGDRKSVV